MSIAAALAELERSPELPDHVAYLQEFLAEEGARREQFQREFAGGRGEFINGRVVVPPPPLQTEADAARCATSLLGAFVSRHQVGEVRGEGSCLIQCLRNDYAPDVSFFLAAKAAGFTPEALLFPPPDLAVEVLSAATADHDRKLKLRDYAHHGVGEYWIIDADDRIVEQYVLPRGAESYQMKARLTAGARLVSVVVAGFAVPVAAFFEAEIHGRAIQGMVP